MSRYSPQTDYFKKVSMLSTIEKYLFFASFLFSILLSIFFKESLISNIISIFLLITLSSISFFIYSLQNKAEFFRRLDFIDNSFGTKLSLKNSIDYYTNDDVNLGLNKLLINVFENSFFSLNVAKKMKPKSLIKIIIGIIILLFFSIYGFARNSSLALLILQLFLSKYFIEDLIVLNDYIKTLEYLQNTIIELLLSKELNTLIGQAKIIKIFVIYETNISHAKILLDEKIFNDMNEKLSEQWKTIKSRYNLEGDL